MHAGLLNPQAGGMTQVAMALQALDLGLNQFSGNLSSIESMTYLQSLRLDDNMFTGSLPVISSPLIEVCPLVLSVSP